MFKKFECLKNFSDFICFTLNYNIFPIIYKKNWRKNDKSPNFVNLQNSWLKWPWLKNPIQINNKRFNTVRQRLRQRQGGPGGQRAGNGDFRFWDFFVLFSYRETRPNDLPHFRYWRTKTEAFSVDMWRKFQFFWS